MTQQFKVLVVASDAEAPSWFRAGTMLLEPGFQQLTTALSEQEAFSVVLGRLTSQCAEVRLPAEVFRQRLEVMAAAYEAAERSRAAVEGVARA